MDGISLVVHTIFSNLPQILLSSFIGLLLGLVAAYVLLKIYGRNEISGGPAGKPYAPLLRKTYKLLTFLSITAVGFFIGAYIGSAKVVKKEIRSSVHAGVELVKDNIASDASTRQQMYEMLQLASKGGKAIVSFNHAVAVVTVDQMNREANRGYLMSKLTSWFAVEAIEEKLWEYEVSILFYVAVLAADKAGIDDMPTQSFDAFNMALTTWMESGFIIETEDIVNYISKFVFKFAKPAVLGLYLPFILIGLGIAIIPLIHSLILKRKLRRALPVGDDMDGKLLE